MFFLGPDMLIKSCRGLTEAEKQQQSHLPACGPVAVLHFSLAACCESGVA